MLNTQTMPTMGSPQPSLAADAADRAMKELRDLDKLVVALPSMFPPSKISSLKRRAEELPPLSSALMLTILLERSFDEVIAAVGELHQAVRQLALLASKSRLPQDTRLAMRLLVDLAGRLRSDIQSCNSLDA